MRRVEFDLAKGQFATSGPGGNVRDISLLLYKCPMMIKLPALSLSYAGSAITSLFSVEWEPSMINKLIVNLDFLYVFAS